MSLDTLTRVFDIEICWVHTVSEGNDRLELAAFDSVYAHDGNEDILPDLSPVFFREIVGLGNNIVIPNIHKNKTMPTSILKRFGCYWFIAVPIRTSRLVGILSVASSKKRRINDDFVDLLGIVSSMIMMTVEKLSLLTTNKEFQGISIAEYHEELERKQPLRKPVVKHSGTQEPAYKKKPAQIQVPIAKKPVQEIPVPEELTDEEPVFEIIPDAELPIEEPVDETPVMQESSVEEPEPETPVTEEPQAEEPVDETPVMQESSVEEPEPETPAAKEPVDETPVVQEPSVEEPEPETPAAEEPQTEEPVDETPVMLESSVEEPEPETPAAEEPQAEESIAEKQVSGNNHSKPEIRIPVPSLITAKPVKKQSSTDTTRVIISDSHLLFREGIRLTLSDHDGFEVTSETYDNQELFEIIEQDQPDIVIMDHTESNNGAGILTRLKRNFPSLSVVLVLDNLNNDSIFLALTHGVTAYFTRDISETAFFEIIRSISEGKVPVTRSLLIPDVAVRVHNAFQKVRSLNGSVGDYVTYLSPTEDDILSDISTGTEVGTIVNRSGNGEGSIDRYLHSIREKLVINYQVVSLIESLQHHLPDDYTVTRGNNNNHSEYVTKQEFATLKTILEEKLNVVL